ncbi:MAG TPA: xyloglucanase, partial [Roseiflexaceae bacterium]|nr:xyloglucanase [Roseiflexaceae bacterium]
SQNGAVLRSSDRGSTWQRSNLPFKVGGNMPGRGMGERLAIDPNRNSTLYLGARSGNGLWRSTDYGATWAKVTSFPNPGNYVPVPGDAYQGDTMGVVWITFDPRTGAAGSTTQTIYVGVADKSTSIYRSTDGGATWAAVPGQPTGFLPHHGVLSSDGFLYIPYSDGEGPYNGTKGDVWKLNTATGVWSNISPIPSSSTENYFGYGGLAVDARNPQTVMVATLNSWWPDAIIYRSTNGGATWSPIWEWAGYPTRSFRYTLDSSGSPWLDFGANPTPPEVTPKLGWMINDLEIDPFNSDRMLYGTGATLYGTDNLTAWDRGEQIGISVKAQGIEETAIQELLSPSAGAPLLSGMYDINGFRHDDLTKVPAKMFSTPSFATTGLDFAENSPNFIARVGSSDSTQRIGFSYDGGGNWFAGSEPAGATNAGKVAVSPDAKTVVWSAPGMPVSLTGNNGSSWAASTGIPSGATVVSDRVNAQKFYGLLNGSFYVSTNGAAGFSLTATNLPTETTKLKAVPGFEGEVWVAGGKGGLWRSSNSGASFSKQTNVQVANVVGYGKAAPGKTYPAIYITGTVDNVAGFFRSDDAGASWVRINDDQHQYASTNTAI